MVHGCSSLSRVGPSLRTKSWPLHEISNSPCWYRASVATIARVPYASQLLSNPDYLYNFTDLAIWSIVECGIAITASSLATLRPLFIQMKILANSHFTGRYGNTYGSGGLPIQSANSVTVISSRGRSVKRNTGLTGSTAFSGSLSQSGALKSVEERQEGIHVEKEFEMSVMTKERSFDSIDRLEAEINEVITPGRSAAKRKPSSDQAHPTRSDSLSSRRRPPPLQTTLQSTSTSADNTASTDSAVSSRRYMPEASSSSNPSSPWAGRRPSEGGILSTTPYNGAMSSPRHQYSLSESSPRTPGVAFSPPSFHLPSRLHHQSTASGQSTLTRYDTRGTIQGLSAPPRVVQNTLDGGYTPSHVATPPLGSPISMSTRADRGLPGSPNSQPGQGSPSRFPFPRQGTIQEAPENIQSRRGKPRVSAFLADAGESSGSSIEEREEREELESPQWARPSPTLYTIPSPLRSNPPRVSGSWV